MVQEPIQDDSGSGHVAYQATLHPALGIDSTPLVAAFNRENYSRFFDMVWVA